MGSRYGKTMPIILGCVTLAALCVLGVFLLRRASTAPSLPADASQSQAQPASAPTAVDPTEQDAAPPVFTTAPAGTETFTEDDAQRLSEARETVRDVIGRLDRIERELQGARYAALKSNPEFQAKVKESQALNREVTELIARLPERIRLERERERNIAEQAKLQDEIARIAKQLDEARKAREDAVAKGESAPVEESAVRQWLTELQQRREDADAARGAVLTYAKDVKRLEMESKQNHPVISAKAAQAEQLRRELEQAIDASDAVADVMRQQAELAARRDALIKECAELTSRSNRVAMATREEGKI